MIRQDSDMEEFFIRLFTMYSVDITPNTLIPKFLPIANIITQISGIVYTFLYSELCFI
jgi:putative flippase GtrA